MQALKELTEETLLIYAEFVEVPDKNGYQMLLCIDKHLKVHIYDLADLQRPRFEFTEEEKKQYRLDLIQPAHSFNLLTDCLVTDYHQAWVKDTFSEIVSEHTSKQNYVQFRMDRLKDRLLEQFNELVA